MLKNIRWLATCFQWSWLTVLHKDRSYIICYLIEALRRCNLIEEHDLCMSLLNTIYMMIVIEDPWNLSLRSKLKNNTNLGLSHNFAEIFFTHSNNILVINFYFNIFKLFNFTNLNDIYYSSFLTYRWFDFNIFYDKNV